MNINDKEQLEHLQFVEALIKEVQIHFQPNSYLDTEKYKSKNYKTLDQTKSLCLFINGYRLGEELIFLQTELPNTENEIFISDVFNYWEGIDKKFLKLFKTTQAYYADAHHTIATSNHFSIQQFLKSFNSFLKAKKNAFKDSNILYNTQSNTQGFLIRKEAGKKAAQNFLTKIASTNSAEKIKLNIVTHSMGYAYSLGLIEVLKNNDKIYLDNFFAIAAENAECGKIELNIFNKNFQFGGAEIANQTNTQVVFDGLAVQQCIVNENEKNIPNFYRQFIPPEIVQGFVDSHIIKNYGWIFDFIKQQIV